MKKLILFFSIVILGATSVYAQPDLPNKCEVFYPEVLLSSSVLKEQDANALLKSSDYGQNNPPRNVKYWIAYSDRSNNTTYTAPGGTEKYKTLEFGQKVRIAKIQNRYALIYKEPVEDEAYPRISQHAESMGWISMDNLLLWHSSIADPKGIYYKALLCINLDAVGSSLGKIYLNPKDKTNYNAVKNDMNFYFVMKREGNLALLSRVHTMDALADNLLIGWLSNDSYVEWNQRACIEPTWDQKDVEYFADEKVQAIIYDSPQFKEAVNKITFKRKEQTGQYDKHMYRQHPDLLRFPILDNGTAELYNCSTFGTADGKVANVETIAEEGASASSYKESVLREMTNINIGIVIDGTSSMESFYPAVKEALKQSIKVFDESKYKVKVGLVIYRDYSNGEWATEKVKLTNPKNPKLDSFLDTGGEYGIKSGGDKTYAEALYLGINTAIDELGFNKNHSNILLVIGDCGNDVEDDKIKQEDIINKLVEQNINLIGFQVRQGNHDAFNLFNSQMGKILKSSLEKRYAQLLANTKVEKTGNEDVSVKIAETKDGYKLINKDDDLFVGSLNYPSFGEEMPVSKLSNLIEEDIIDFADMIQKHINLVDLSLLPGFANSSNSEGFSKFEEAFVRSKLGDERYEVAQQAGAMFAFKGYTPKKHTSGTDFFKPIIFISSDELNTLIERLAPVNAASSQLHSDPNADRSSYITAMKSLIQVMVPDEASDERMNKMTYDEIMQLASGLNVSAAALNKGYSLAELASPEAVPFSQFSGLISDFNRKFKKLQDLKTKPYKYSKTMSGVKYYWLPVEDLP